MITSGILLDVAGVHVTPSTVIRRLKKRDIRARRAATKFFLTAQHAEQRLAFAVQFRAMNEEYWARTIFLTKKPSGTAAKMSSLISLLVHLLLFKV